jgi:hypothetical protein
MDPHSASGAHVEVHEGLSGAGDEPVAVVAVSVLAALIAGICTLWVYSIFH